jgi:hypothetical protein
MWSRILVFADQQRDCTAALTCAGTHCFVLPLRSILGVDMPGAYSSRRTFDIVLYDHKGDVIYELSQVDARDVSAWADYMVRNLFHRVPTIPHRRRVHAIANLRPSVS